MGTKEEEVLPSIADADDGALRLDDRERERGKGRRWVTLQCESIIASSGTDFNS
jgi:hypothetical protein